MAIRASFLLQMTNQPERALGISQAMEGSLYTPTSTLNSSDTGDINRIFPKPTSREGQEYLLTSSPSPAQSANISGLLLSMLSEQGFLLMVGVVPMPKRKLSAQYFGLVSNR